VFTTVPGFLQWDRVSVFARGRVEAIVASSRDAAMFIRAGGEWHVVRSGALIADGLPAGGVPAAVLAAAEAPADPYFRSAMGTLRLDASGYLWTLTDVERGDGAGEYWIATSGGGLQRFDSRTSRREWYRFGLTGTGVASIATLSGRLWFGGDGRGERTGVSRATPDLIEWQQYDATRGAPRGFVAEVTEFGGSTWFAASDGLYRLRPGAGEAGEWSRLVARSGLPSDRVRSLQVAGGLLWVGTDQGLSAFDTSGHRAVGSLLPGLRISRMGARNDTLFVASETGIWALPLSAGAQTPLRGVLRRPVADLVIDGDDVWLIAGEQLYRSESAGAPERDPALERIGPPFRLALQDGRLWVAGPRGIAHRDPVTGAWEAFTTPADIPAGPVLDVVPTGNDVWAATPLGAVRLRWR
jgi:ligand-binding sensor domain-containing protein